LRGGADGTLELNNKGSENRIELEREIASYVQFIYHTEKFIYLTDVVYLKQSKDL
jgi:hypothetical protein